MPFGGKYQLSESEASVQKLPVFGTTNTTSVMSYGYHPELSVYSPYLGGSYSVVEALARLVAVGASYKQARLTCQEYFERLNQDSDKWGKPTQALLGLIEAQIAFKTPAIGGKDSMSGTYKDVHVPPTLITFAITTEHVDNIISSEFKEDGNYIYYVKHVANDDQTPNYELLMNNFDAVKAHVDAKHIISASSVKFGGVSEALSKMSFGNKVGVEVSTTEDLYSISLGSLVVESNIELHDENFILLGKTTKEATLSINDTKVSIEEAIHANEKRYLDNYPTHTDNEGTTISTPVYEDESEAKASISVDEVKVLIPVFPGNNCEYDCAQAFTKAGATPEIYVFNNLNVESTRKSIEQLSEKIKQSQILMIPGGFSSGDEPDGSGKFIANVLMNEKVNEAIQHLLSNDGLILGICNGFQALIKAGLLPYGDISQLDENAPTLFRNNINRHVSHIASTRITSNKSPWMKGFDVNDVHQIAMSHGEGKFVVSEEMAKQLINGDANTVYNILSGKV